MLILSTLLLALSTGDEPRVESIFLQSAPLQADGKFQRTAGRDCAVILIHGYYFHLTNRAVPKAALRPWQKPDSNLVKELSQAADVFVFAYGQDVTIDTIAKESKLAGSIAQLRKLGYREIVLVGHSAGGLVARHFVEDHPDAGVTRVLQLATPNAGSPLANLTVLRSQRTFVECLTEEGRKKCLADRANKQIPAKVEFVCVVTRGDGRKGTDGVVPCVNQWTLDLQKQGIPAVGVLGAHLEIVRDQTLAATLARLATTRHTRWTPVQVEKARAELFRVGK